MYKNFEKGRSMIEMLGVLAIIAVLSVGGIAGYSKAMQEYKINKAISEYSMVLSGTMEYLEQIQNLTTAESGSYRVSALDIVQALNLLPQNWSFVKDFSGDLKYAFVDSIGNSGNIYSRGKLMVFTLGIGGVIDNKDGTGTSNNYSSTLCLKLMQNVAVPLSGALHDLFLYRSKGTSYKFYGDKYCTKNVQCLRQLSIDEMHKYCSSCSPEAYCSFTMQF